MAVLNFVLQGKGGVGKSLVASVLASYYSFNEEDVLSIDTDPVNATFAQFESLDVIKMPVMTEDYIDPRKFDAFLSQIIEQKKTTIIDVGSNSFVGLCSYLLSNQTFTLLEELGFQCNIHTIIAGGQNLQETTKGFIALAKQFPTEVNKIVWINPYFGDVIYQDQNDFKTSKSLKQYQDSIKGIIEIPKLKKDLHETDYQIMLSKGITLNEINTPKMREIGFGVIEMHRIGIIREKFYSSIKTIDPLLFD